jgi:hypothetical protein
MFAEKLMQDDAARNGDMTAARIVIDRLVPVRKGAPVTFNLPAIKTAADVVSALGTVAQEMAAGELTPRRSYLGRRCLGDQAPRNRDG